MLGECGCGKEGGDDNFFEHETDQTKIIYILNYLNGVLLNKISQSFDNVIKISVYYYILEFLKLVSRPPPNFFSCFAVTT